MTRLYRSHTDKKLFGLCGGLAETLGVDSTLLRLIVVVTAVFSGGVVIPLYLLASFVIPKEPGLAPNFAHGGHGRYAHTADPFMPRHEAKPQNNLDEMMKDIEKKAMWKEIEELRAKLNKYENSKGDV